MQSTAYIVSRDKVQQFRVRRPLHDNKRSVQFKIKYLPDLQLFCNFL